MARIRTIKPSFFTDDELSEVSPLGRLLFIGLWTLADCDGRLEFRPKRLKAELLPYDDCDVVSLLSELEQRGFIHRYASDVSECICIPTFRKHQRITGKEAETQSELPRCSYGCGPDSLGKHSGNTGETPETTGREGKGREGKGGEAADKRPPFVLIRKDGNPAAITETKIAEWLALYPGVDVRNICRRLQELTRTKPRSDADDSLAWAESMMAREYEAIASRRLALLAEPEKAAIIPHHVWPEWPCYAQRTADMADVSEAEYDAMAQVRRTLADRHAKANAERESAALNG